jgi:hypothetical protein
MLGVVIFAASVAQAGSMHHNHAEMVSPFDKIQSIKPLHCALNMHQHLLKSPCPHKERSGKNSGEMIRSDCGSSTGTANTSGSSLAKDLFKDLNHDGFLPLQYFSRIKPPLDILAQNYPRSIDHPPQLI